MNCPYCHEMVDVEDDSAWCYCGARFEDSAWKPPFHGEMKPGECEAFLSVHCPDMFADPEFAAWLRRRAGYGLATWHLVGQSEPAEWSDVFIIYDHGEGSESSCNADGMPHHCWRAICRLCEKEGVGYACVRLTNT